MDVLNEFMSDHNFPTQMRRRANRFCFYTYEVQRGGQNRQSQVRTLLHSLVLGRSPPALVWQQVVGFALLAAHLWEIVV